MLIVSNFYGLSCLVFDCLGSMIVPNHISDSLYLKTKTKRPHLFAVFIVICESGSCEKPTHFCDHLRQVNNNFNFVSFKGHLWNLDINLW